MITTRPTRLNLSTDLSKRETVAAGTRLSTLARIYGGQVLKVSHDGKEWYTANPDWKAPEVTESVEQPDPPPAAAPLPWEGRPKRGRGRPRKEK
jgi:hypothetical protein